MKNKSFLKFLPVILCAALILCTILLSTVIACGKKQDEDPQSTPGEARNPINIDFHEPKYEGTHIYKYTPTGKYIISDRKSDYAIMYPSGCSEKVKDGVNDLVTYLASSSKVVLDTVEDGKADRGKGGKYISVGNTSLAKKAGVKADLERLGESGFIIKTVGDNVYLLGGGDIGTTYAAYEFLARTVDFRVYYSNMYHYDEKEDIELYDFDITDIPDYVYRLRNYGAYNSDNMFSHRMRVDSESDIWIPVDKNNWHNVFNYLPPAAYADDHPDWYSADKKQLCFNAHGNKEELELMYKLILAKAIECAEACPDANNITFTQQDGAYWCTCEACTEEKAKYGTGAPAVIQICNRLAKDLNDYFKPDNRTINVCLFAYHNTSNAPVKTNSDGTFSPIDEKCVCGEHVYVFCIPQTDSRYSMYDPRNAAGALNTKAWASLTDQLYIWKYETNFDNYMMPYNSFDSMQGSLQFLKGLGANYVFSQGQYNQNTSTGWSILKMWLNSRLLWNVNLDFNDLLDEFFSNFYMDAEKPMREMFDMFRIHMKSIEARYSPETGTNTNLLKQEYWPYAFLKQLLAKADEAYRAIEVYKKQNPDLYSVLYDRICLETLSYRYIEITLYNGLRNSQEQINVKKEFRADAERLGLTRFNEWYGINELWTVWKLN